MGTTRTTVLDRARRSSVRLPVASRATLKIEDVALAAASVIVVAALLLTYQAKREELAAEASRSVQSSVLNVSMLADPSALEPVLASAIRDAADRRFTARILYRGLTADGQHPPSAENVGALARIRVPVDEARRSNVPRLQARAEASPTSTGIAVLSTSELAEIKPALAVRSSSAFSRSVWRSAAVYLLSIYAVLFYWRWRRFDGDPWLLPIAHLLTGLGCVAMLALQDPLRDRLLIEDFTIGVAIGCGALAALSSMNYQASALRRLSLVPLFAAALLSVLLIVFGSGPGTSDAKVNLFGMQPVEIIRVLLVLFLAGYFASRWEFVRQLREEQFGGLELPKRFRVPRYDHVLPVIVGVGVALLLFFLQKDLGPALVFGCLFLSLYGVARSQVALVAIGLVLMLGGFVAGYTLGYPATIATRVAMWLSPWENAMRGGDHVAQALWGFSSGGLSGSGLGLGAPSLIPEAHTDMVLATLGEELGFAGIAVVAVLYATLCYRGVTIALRSHGDYAFFLALGLILSLILPAVLIGGGTLGVLPLSGVATPFLSYGKSSMIVNLAVLGMLFGIARENARGNPVTEPFARQVKVVAALVALLGAVIVARAAQVQVFAADATMARSTLTPQGDGVLRYQDNPRLRRASLMLPRGVVSDRRGIPLAVSDCGALDKFKQSLQQLNGSVPCDSRASRHYPLGGDTFHLLGDARTRVNWAASNTSFAERDHDDRLRGFDDEEQSIAAVDPRTGRETRALRRDYAELVPLWRYRHRPGHPEVRRLLERPRDLRVTIDARLQARLSDALDRQLAAVNRTRGAIVVMDAGSGEVLAMINAPRPRVTDATALGLESMPDSDDPALFDRARYGLYPPGSTFKLVTATAALRKDPALAEATFICRLLPGGRIGNTIPGWSRPIRDDELDRVPHGSVNLRTGVEQSCNAYFAQLGMRVGAQALHDTSELFEIAVAQPDTAERLRNSLPQAAYGQGEVRTTPFKMARVVAAIANGGRMPSGRWIDGDSDTRDREPVDVMTTAAASQIASYMRGVVVRGTARSLAAVSPPIAGKTGTAEVQGAPSHSWFAGFAPYGQAKGRRIAFAVLIENGGYGGRSAAPLARDIVQAAREFGLFDEDPR